MNQLINELFDDKTKLNELKSKPIEFHQWFIYDEIINSENSDRHDIVALNILLKFEYRKYKIEHILNIIESNKYLLEFSLCKSFLNIIRLCFSLVFNICACILFLCVSHLY